MKSRVTKKNRLQNETSPYLKQHQDNPVDWYPWGEEALAKAKAEHKPILLSIGYSACHWCHVMAHECFENPDIAKIMNDLYVNIKVDREERPDLDHIYQPVAQMIMKGGGWPLTVFLTPDLKPYYGGTYFPPADRQGRPGFPKLLMALSEAYRTTREEVLERAEKITEIIQESDEFSGNENFALPATLVENQFQVENAKEVLGNALDRLLTMVDWQNGGFGDAPKFPNPMILHFLWRMSQMEWVMQTHRTSARDAVLLTLKKMACGGIFDQLGGGFHRYSVDELWLVPHFEKMLYDNALLLKIYSEVLLSDPSLTSEQQKLYLDTLQKTVRYVEREMTSPDGLFYSAQDADSEGEEGKFFVWDQAELQSILEPDEYHLFCMAYEITEQGNFEHGKTILARQSLAALYASDLNDHPQFALATQKVFEAREKRVKPNLDSKSLVSWNGLMISGLSWATLALEQRGDSSLAVRAKNLAVTAFTEIKEKASQTQGGLSATVQEGKPRFDGYLDDYAFIAQAALDLGRINPEKSVEYAADTQIWLNKLAQDFKDPSSLGYFFTQGHHGDLIHRPKTFFDQAIPSANAMIFQLLMVQNETQINDIYGRAEVELSILLRSVTENPYGLGEVLNAALLRIVGPVVIHGQSEMSSNPFCFTISSELVSNQSQYCHQKKCVLGKFDLSSLYR